VSGSGSGLAGVEVSLSRSEGDLRRATTDADGKFRIAGLEAGAWTATLKCKGYADRVVEVVVNGNLTIAFDLIPAF
jgi:hypothetical protein